MTRQPDSPSEMAPSEVASSEMVSLRTVRKSFGAVEVIPRVDLDVARGEFIVFVGPSGSGKSTLLRIIAGLEEPSDGDVLIDGQDVTFAEPAERGIAMVFQSYALYPHMNVAGNMAFNLRISSMTRAQIDARVGEAARILQLETLLKRRPSELSGGQRQRVAIGRAIVREPKVFLFDEPLSNLDAALRVEMRLEIERLHRELGTTMIYVTHDQVEAMTLADRIVVLDQGEIQQVGAPMDLYTRPANQFVAQFLGSPRINLLPASVLGARAPANAATIGVRPEAMELLAPDHGEDNDNGQDAMIALDAATQVIERLGGISFGYFRSAEGTQLVAQLAPSVELQHGQRVRLGFRPAHIHAFDAEGATLTIQPTRITNNLGG